jgi:hypothetical protein
VDAYHFGSRLPWGARLVPQNQPYLPQRPDVFQLDDETFDRLDDAAVELLPYSARYVEWAGATWPGINFWDDSRSVDFLLSRPEIDPDRIACVGHSGGGFRSHFLAALDDRIRASVSSGWFTTGDWTQAYAVIGPVGPAHLVPGLWQRLDFADLALMSAPRAKLVICGTHDNLWAPEAMIEASEVVAEGYRDAGVPESYQFFNPDKGHTFDVECLTKFQWAKFHLSWSASSKHVHVGHWRCLEALVNVIWDIGGQ